MVVLGAEGAKSENDIGGNMPDPGRYHVVITAVDESFDKYNSITVDFQVLTGNKPGQVDRTLTEYFSVSEKAIPRLKRLALCVGLLQPGEAEREIEFEQAVGRQLVIEVEENEYEKNGEKKKGRRISWVGMWSTGNKEVADVPKDVEALKLLDGEQSPSPPPGNDDTPSANGNAKPDKWDNL